MTHSSNMSSLQAGGDAVPVSRRGIVVCAGLAPLLGACSNRPLRPVEADGTFCFRLGTSRRKVCTPVPVPAASVEADAKRFRAVPGLTIVYIVRNRWGDAVERLPVFIGEHATVVTIPRSLVRARVAPGQLRLSFEWEGRSEQHQVSGSAGEIVFVELVGSFWAWGGEYRWEAGADHKMRHRANNSKLIADLDLSATAHQAGRP